MSLLVLDRIDKWFRSGLREQIVLRDVSLQLDAGELVGVWGMRRSGRTTLLRVAAGLEAPDSGMVSLNDQDLAVHGRRLLGSGIGYVRKTLRSSEEQGVLEEVATGLLARGIGVREARTRARAALAMAGAENCASMQVSELGGGEIVRIALARVLALSPAVVVVDEPTAAVGLSERDEILALLRNLAGHGMSVLASTGEADELAGFHRALTLGQGELRGPSTPQLAPVVALRRLGV
jgi:energy-coupling factor transporter ATP-binding protein EcfA2